MKLPQQDLPPFPGWAAALGPGIVWMALAQGSGELIWWPYLIAKYGLVFLSLLIPACLLQYPLSTEIGRYTLLTGESIFHGFIRLHRGFGIFLWLLMTLSFLWFGAFASAGGTALAALTDFPAGWSARGQTLFWGYCSIAVFFCAIFFSGVVYKLIENVMKLVALITLVGLLWACAQPQVRGAMAEFFAAIFAFPQSLPASWDDQDASKLLTAISFAGLGGFWILFYSYWLREKGAGMAAHSGHITGIGGAAQAVNIYGHLPQDTPANQQRWHSWRRYLKADVWMGLIGNLLTTLMTCLLAFALLYPKGLIPNDYELAVVQAQFFEVSWGAIGRILFLLVAASFLADTWLATVDGVARLQADIVQILFVRARKIPQRRWYLFFIVLLTAITCVTMPLATPGALIQISAVIGFIGTVIFPLTLYRLNYRLLAPQLPSWARPEPPMAWALLMSFVAYLTLALLYVFSLLTR